MRPLPPATASTIPAAKAASARPAVAHAERCTGRARYTIGDSAMASRLASGPGARDMARMLSIDLKGKRALVAGVADDGGFGFAIAKALAEAGASICVGTWPPALNIFENLIRRGKMDESRKLSRGGMLEFERIYPLDAAYDKLLDVPEDVRTTKRYAGPGDFPIAAMAAAVRKLFCDNPL